MKARHAAIFAVLLAVAVGAGGYAAGVRGWLTKAPQPNASMIASASTGPQSLSDGQRSEVEGIIRNFLIANPEIVRDAIDAMQAKDDAATAAQQVAAISANKDLIFSSPRQVVLGNPKGDVTLVEFFDYNCAYCRRAHADMLKLLQDDPKLRIVLKEFPILSDGSVQAAQIAAAVQLTAPDKYAAFHNELITDPGEVDGAKALAVADDLGLDTTALKVKADSDAAKAFVSEAHDLADKLNLTGTPSYVTADQVVVGAVGYDALKAAVDKARADCAAKTVAC